MAIVRASCGSFRGGNPTGSWVGGPGYATTETPPMNFPYRLGTAAMAKAAEDPPGRAGSIFVVASQSERPIQPLKIDWIRIRDVGQR